MSRDVGTVEEELPAEPPAPSEEGRRWDRPLSVALILAVGVGSILVAPAIPGVNAVVVALAVGLLIANIGGALRPDAVAIEETVSKFVLKRILKLAVILLGAGIDLALVATVGTGALVVITVSVLLAIAIAALVGPRAGLNGRSSVLIGVGTAICGASAIVAVAPVLQAKKHEIGVALGTILTFNALALITYPLVGNVFDFSPITFGTWSGVAVHDTASAVATGFALGPESGEVATLVKLTRTLYLIPIMVAVAGWVSIRRGATESTGTRTAQAVASSIPWFVFGFAVLAVLNTVGLLGGFGEALNDAAKILIVFVVATIGLTLRFSQVASLGRRLFITGFVASATIGVASLGLIYALGVGR